MLGTNVAAAEGGKLRYGLLACRSFVCFSRMCESHVFMTAAKLHARMSFVPLIYEVYFFHVRRCRISETA